MNQISNNSYKFLSGFISETPHYGYLVAAAVLLFWLIGVICGWNGPIHDQVVTGVISCWIYWTREPIVWYLEYSLL